METEITVYGPLRSATGAKTVSLEWSGETVADAIAALVDAYPRAESHLYDGDAVRPSVRASIDGERAELEDRVPDGASLTLVPAVQGGSDESTAEPLSSKRISRLFTDRQGADKDFCPGADTRRETR